MVKQEKINLSWILHSVPKSILFFTLVLCIFSSFEAILNGYIIGQIVNINTHDYAAVCIFLIKSFVAYAITYSSIYGFLSLKSMAIKHLNIHLKYLFFNSGFNRGNDGSKVTNKITNVSKQIEQNYFNPMFMIIQVSITIISSLTFILKTNLVLGMVYLAFSFMSLLPSYIGSKRLNAKTNVWSKSNSALINVLEDIVKGRSDILNFGVRKSFFRLFKQKLDNEESSYRNMSQYQYAIQLASWGIALVSFLGPVAIGIYLSRFSVLGITNSAIISLVLTSDSVVGGMRELTSYQSFIKSTTDIRTVECVEAKKQVIVKHEPQNNKIQDGLFIKDLSVQYNRKKIINGVNLFLKNNAKAIIVGPSGIGKSTLLNAITGSVPISNGIIKFNGYNILNQDYVLISQNIWIFDGTLRDNITLYQNFSDQEVLDAIKKLVLIVS